MRCIVCGSSQLDPQGYKCALCGGAPGVRAEQCYITENTKAKLLAHADDLKALGMTLEEYRPIQKDAGVKLAVLALAIQIADSLQAGSLRKLILYLQKIKIQEDEILRLRLDEPEQISKTLKSAKRARQKTTKKQVKPKTKSPHG
jgi:hypothetical protein